MPVTLDDVRELDRHDPLASFKTRFALPEGVIYLDGNSLGAQPAAAGEAVEALMAQWRDALIQGWNQGWFDAPERLGDRLAPLLGAEPGEMLVTDTITHNLFKLLGYITEGQGITEGQARSRPVILSEGGNFPTDGYIAQGFCRFAGFEHRWLPEGDDVVEHLDSTVAVVVLSHVHYRTGRLRDMPTITQQVHASGAEVIWDLAHSAGALPVDLAACDVRYAVGCTYKYLNGGPGAPAFLYVRRDCQAQGWQPLSGWLGHASPFSFAADYVPASGISRFRTGTHSPLAYAALEASLAVWQEVDLAALRRKSQRLIELFRESLADCLDAHGIADITPTEAQRGSQVALMARAPGSSSAPDHGSSSAPDHGSSNAPDHGYAIVQALIERGVIGDYREPRLMRFGFAPLYLSHEDVWRAAQHLREVLAAGEHLAPRFRQRGAVT